jgi:hypothetical protein
MRCLKIKKENLIAVLVIAACIFLYTLPLFFSLNKSQTLIHKNQVSNLYLGYLINIVSNASMASDKCFPSWVPFESGGLHWNVLPVNLSFSPFILLVFAFGSVTGLNLSWYLAYFSGALSMFYLARYVFKYNVFGAVFCSLVFSMCGFFPVLQQCGLFYNRDLLFLPLLAAFFIRAQNNNKFIVYTALFFSAFFFTTLLFVPLIIFFLFMLSLLSIFKKENNKIKFQKRSVIVFVSVVILIVFFSAFRIFPLLEFTSVNTGFHGELYETADIYFNSLSLLVKRLFVPENLGTGSMYFGYLPVMLFLFSGIVLFKRMAKWLILFVFFTILSFGPNFFFDLHFVLWQYLPFFKSMSSLSKYYGIIMVFLISIVGGGFFNILQKKLSAKKLRIVSIIVISYVFVDLLLANISYFTIYNYDLKLKEPKSFNSTIRLVNMHKGDEGGTYALKLALYPKGFGTINYHIWFSKYFDRAQEVNPRYFIIPKFAFLSPSTKIQIVANPAYKGEAVFVNDINEVKNFSITSKNIDIIVNVRKPDRLIINQRYDPGWKSKNGRVENHNGILSVSLERLGSYPVKLYFFPLSFYLGVLISIVTLIFCLIIFNIPKFYFWR